MPIPAIRPALMMIVAVPWSGSGSDRGRLRKRRASVGDVVEIDKAAALADDVEQIAMLAGRRVGPFARRTLAGFASFQPDEHGAARRVPHVADQPVTALAATVGEIMTAHRLGIARETVRQFGSIVRASLRRRPFGDALDRIALQHLGEDRRPSRRRSGRTCGASTR